MNERKTYPTSIYSRDIKHLILMCIIMGIILIPLFIFDPDYSHQIRLRDINGYNFLASLIVIIILIGIGMWISGRKNERFIKSVTKNIDFIMDEDAAFDHGETVSYFGRKCGCLLVLTKKGLYIKYKGFLNFNKKEFIPLKNIEKAQIYHHERTVSIGYPGDIGFTRTFLKLDYKTNKQLIKYIYVFEPEKWVSTLKSLLK